MVQATFTLGSSDFNESLFERIKIFLQGQKAVVKISIEPLVPPRETKEEYFANLRKSIAEMEKGEGVVTFTMEEFEAFTQKK